MKRLRLLTLAALFPSTVSAQAMLQEHRPGGAAERHETLRDARRGFETKLIAERRAGTPVPAPPPELFTVVEYDAPLGASAAYLSPVAEGESGRPAIVWITGGTPVARGGAYVWVPGPVENDQSIRAYRDAGVVMMFPTVRGTCQNPGAQEAFFGEVDDVIAAGQYLRGLPQIDPERVYLGGHSTGGTLALLVAESTDLFRAVFSFGPVGDLADYGERPWPFDTTDPRELRLRSPLYFLGSITSPTYIFEGEFGNSEELPRFMSHNSNPRVSVLQLAGADHFSLLTPVNRHLAAVVVADRPGPFELDLARVVTAHAEFWPAQREARDLRLIADLRAEGVAWGTPCEMTFTIRGRTLALVSEVRRSLAMDGFESSEPRTELDQDGDPYHRLTLSCVVPLDTPSVFAAAQIVRGAADAARLVDEGWTASPAR
ncbi:MAG: prolyl oligopeptidase family serine peptidase [Planctomycetota bacterium]